MVNKILQLLSIRCSHRKISQPFAAASVLPVSRTAGAQWDAPSSSSSRHYVVCLDCGRKFEYDWVNMRMMTK